MQQEKKGNGTLSTVGSAVGAATVGYGVKEIMARGNQAEVLQKVIVDKVSGKDLEGISKGAQEAAGKLFNKPEVGNGLLRDAEQLVSGIKTRAGVELGDLPDVATTGKESAQSIRNFIGDASKTVKDNLDKSVEGLDEKAATASKKTVKDTLSSVKENFGKMGELSGLQWAGVIAAGVGTAVLIHEVTKPKEQVQAQGAQLAGTVGVQQAAGRQAY